MGKERGLEHRRRSLWSGQTWCRIVHSLAQSKSCGTDTDSPSRYFPRRQWHVNHNECSRCRYGSSSGMPRSRMRMPHNLLSGCNEVRTFRNQHRSMSFRKSRCIHQRGCHSLQLRGCCNLQGNSLVCSSGSLDSHRHKQRSLRRRCSRVGMWRMSDRSMTSGIDSCNQWQRCRKRRLRVCCSWPQWYKSRRIEDSYHIQRRNESSQTCCHSSVGTVSNPTLATCCGTCMCNQCWNFH